MRNSRVRERFELALDGRQIAGLVVGALVVVGVAFGLGVNVGKHLTAAEVAAARSGDLQRLDAGATARPVAATPRPGEITFVTALPAQKPQTPPPAEKKPIPPPLAAGTGPSAPAAPAAPFTAPAPVQATPPPDVVAPRSEEAAAVAAQAPPSEVIPGRAALPSVASAARGSWSVQVASVQGKAEADKIADRYRRLSPWVEVADIPGKGRYYRVRTGRFATREDAERYRQDVARETGLKAIVTSAP
ncbi:MAG: SPOR domain-containing protein [Anaeromyxobacter sp.]